MNHEMHVAPVAPGSSLTRFVCYGCDFTTPSVAAAVAHEHAHRGEPVAHVNEREDAAPYDPSRAAL